MSSSLLDTVLTVGGFIKKFGLLAPYPPPSLSLFWLVLFFSLGTYLWHEFAFRIVVMSTCSSIALQRRAAEEHVHVLVP